MIKNTPNIINVQNERIDTWVEWDEKNTPKSNVVMVHGLGTDKHETAGYFDDIASVLVSNNFRVIRFDFTGYGLSEGLQRDACYTKHVGDLKAVIDYVRRSFSEPIHIFAQSMGCFVTALTMPKNIVKTIMTGIPNTDTSMIIDRVSSRFGSRPGAVLKYDDISLLPRSTGKIQEIGPKFWQDIKNLKPVDIVGSYAKETELLVVSWKNDEIIGHETLEQYDAIPKLQHIWLSGDHSITNPTDRQEFIKVMLNFYNK